MRGRVGVQGDEKKREAKLPGEAEALLTNRGDAGLQVLPNFKRLGIPKKTVVFARFQVLISSHQWLF